MEVCAVSALAFSLGTQSATTAQAACGAYAPLIVNADSPLIGKAEGLACYYYNSANVRMSYGDDIIQNCIPSEAAPTPTPTASAPASTASASSVNCTGPCTVTLALKPVELEPQRLQDMAQLWGLFLAVFVVIYCAKQFLKFFESAPHGE